MSYIWFYPKHTRKSRMHKYIQTFINPQKIFIQFYILEFYTIQILTKLSKNIFYTCTLHSNTFMPYHIFKIFLFIYFFKFLALILNIFLSNFYYMYLPSYDIQEVSYICKILFPYLMVSSLALNP